MIIGILGAGAWGTALAIALAGREAASRHRVTLWARNVQQAERMRVSRCNERYLPRSALPPDLQVQSELTAVLQDADLLIVATPVAGMRQVLRAVAEQGYGGGVVWVCKGFEAGNARLPHQIFAEELGDKLACGVLSGPSFAAEVALGLPTALTLASRDLVFAREWAAQLHQPKLRVYYNDDVEGVELGGAVKNVMAIATGISDGMALGMNARAALITRGLSEIARLGTNCGGRPETFMGLAGLGDLILTCTGDLSRNRAVGLRLAKGESLAAILEDLGHVAEGVNSARECWRLAEVHQIDMPITRAVCEVLFEGKAPQAALQALLSRDPKLEN